MARRSRALRRLNTPRGLEGFELSTSTHSATWRRDSSPVERRPDAEVFEYKGRGLFPTEEGVGEVCPHAVQPNVIGGVMFEMLCPGDELVEVDGPLQVFIERRDCVRDVGP